MATVRDMLNAYAVVTKLSNNPNLHVTTSYKFLPLLDFLTEVSDKYEEFKKKIIAEDTGVDEKEKAFRAYLDLDVELPEIQIGVNSLRSCGLTMIDLKNINWWLVEFLDEYE